MASEVSSAVLSSGPNLLVGLTCNVHPVVLMMIIDSYERRNEDNRRVIGTLLGTVEKGVVEISNCFAVPHEESKDEVAFHIEYSREVIDLYRKVNPNEVLVGWYSTGSDVLEQSILVHEYYKSVCKNPVHLIVDTTLKTGHMPIKAYVSVPLGVPEKTLGTMFSPVPLNLLYNDSERTGLDVMLDHKERGKKVAPLSSDMQQVTATCQQAVSRLDAVIAYIEGVLEGKIPSDPEVGRMLLQACNKVSSIKEDAMKDVVNSTAKDLLMVMYLSNLTKTQLNIAQKLHQQI